MRRVVATGRSDVGQIRKSNEDALLSKESVFAVADGMGGHLAGEVAAATALEPIADLDGKVFPDATAAVTALRDAVVSANATVSELAQREPSYHGMGTTLTAAMVEGRRLHVAHVGDSRAYLLRDGQFSQLTDDHTLVQHLIDEGQITREEAASHPQRSIITRAIGVSPEVEVDSMSLDLEPGDQLLLCSDGLTGVIDDEEIARRLAAREDPETTVHGLIARANEAGGPDNITVLLLRYEDPDAPARTPAAPRTITISTRDDRPQSDWAGQLGNYGSLTRGGPVGDAEDDDPQRAGRMLGRAAAIVLAIAVLGGLIVGGAQFLLSRSFFVGLDGSEVVIYEGIDAEIGPFELYRVVERPGLTLDEVPIWYRTTLENGLTATDLADARRQVNNAPRRDATVDLDAADADAPQEDPQEDPREDPQDDTGDGNGTP